MDEPNVGESISRDSLSTQLKYSIILYHSRMTHAAKCKNKQQMVSKTSRVQFIKSR